MDIIWKYGPPGLASVILRREFIEAAELLKKVVHSNLLMVDRCDAVVSILGVEC